MNPVVVATLKYGVTSIRMLNVESGFDVMSNNLRLLSKNVKYILAGFRSSGGQFGGGPLSLNLYHKRGLDSASAAFSL